MEKIVITKKNKVKQLPEKEARKLVDSGLARAVITRERMTNEAERKTNDH